MCAPLLMMFFCYQLSEKKALDNITFDYYTSGIGILIDVAHKEDADHEIIDCQHWQSGNSEHDQDTSGIMDTLSRLGTHRAAIFWWWSSNHLADPTRGD